MFQLPLLKKSLWECSFLCFYNDFLLFQVSSFLKFHKTQFLQGSSEETSTLHKKVLLHFMFYNIKMIVYLRGDTPFLTKLQTNFSYKNFALFFSFLIYYWGIFICCKICVLTKFENFLKLDGWWGNVWETIWRDFKKFNETWKF